MSMTHEITTGVLRNKLPKRKGRGEPSGHGTTDGRGAQNLRGEAFESPKPKKKFIPREPVKKPKKGAEEPGEAGGGGEAKKAAAPAPAASAAEAKPAAGE